jgi:hypothetical protein
MTGVMPDQAVDLHELGDEPVGMDCLDAVDEQLITRLAGRARARGLALKGEGGLLAQLTKRLVESALEGEITDHLGYYATTPSGATAGTPARPPDQDRADRGRSGRDRRPARPRRHLRTEDRRRAAAAAVWGRRAGDLVVGEGPDAMKGAGLRSSWPPGSCSGCSHHRFVEAPNHCYRVGRRVIRQTRAWPPGGEHCWPLDVESCSQIVPCPVCRENSIAAGMLGPTACRPRAGVSTA